MNLKIRSLSGALLSGGLALLMYTWTGVPAVGAGGDSLPVVRILGDAYYYYEVGKNESLYAIAREMGWDMETLNRVNPNLSSPLEKGSVIYYPVGADTDQLPGDEGNNNDTPAVSKASPKVERSSGRQFSHVVEKGETVYSIGKLYNITTDAIYSLNPSAQYGIKAGETLKIEADNNLSHSEGGYIYHEVKEGETLYGLSKRYNSSVADILTTNPGLTENSLRSGTTIRIVPDSKKARMVRENVEEQRVISVTNYRVKKKDTWMKIARATGVSAEMLRAANPDVSILEKGQVLVVPRTETVTESRLVQQEDPRDTTEEGRRQVYEEVHALNDVEDIRNIKVALLLEDYSSNKDMEFTRGMLLATGEMKYNNFKTTVNVIDGKVSADSVVNQLNRFEPDLIVTTYDKNFPEYVYEFGNRPGIMILNAFDVKNDEYLNNPGMVQLLTPTHFFNAEIASDFSNRFDGRTLIVAGDTEGEDSMLEAILSVYQGTPLYTPTSEIENFEPLPGEDYIIYGTPSRKEDARQLLEKVAVLKEKSPESEICVMGRPSWISFADALHNDFSRVVVYVRSRFYFDSEEMNSRRMIADYRDLYGRTPIKSYPVYAVSGYDIGKYFIPGLAQAGGDFNAQWPAADALQTDFAFIRPNTWSGLYNPVVYLVKFNEFGSIDKIEIK